MPRPKSIHDEIAATKLAIEKAKLAKLEKDLPKASPHFTRYEDIPAPSPEERERFTARLTALTETLEARAAQDKRDWYLSMIHFAP